MRWDKPLSMTCAVWPGPAPTSRAPSYTVLDQLFLLQPHWHSRPSYELWPLLPGCLHMVFPFWGTVPSLLLHFWFRHFASTRTWFAWEEVLFQSELKIGWYSRFEAISTLKCHFSWRVTITRLVDPNHFLCFVFILKSYSPSRQNYLVYTVCAIHNKLNQYNSYCLGNISKWE